MAQLQDVAGKHRSRRQDHKSTSRHRDWESRHEPFPHSLPYRTPKSEVQRSDLRKPPSPVLSPRRRRRHSEDLPSRNPMSPASKQLIKRSPTAVVERGGKGHLSYESDDDGDDDNDEVEDITQERLRSRLGGPKPRSNNRGDDSHDSDGDTDTDTTSSDESIQIATPTRSSRVYRSAPESDHSSRSSSRTSSVDSSSSASTREDRRKRRARKNILPAVPEPIPAETVHRTSRRQHRAPILEPIIQTDESEPEPIYEEPLDIDERPPSTRRPRAHQSDHREKRPTPTPREASHSRQNSEKHYHHRDRRQEEQSSSSTKRPLRNKYYESDTAYTTSKPPLPRSRTASSSRITSTRSISSSSKRSSVFMDNLFRSTPHVQRAEKSVETVECVVCLDDVPSHKAPKLKCGHHMCRVCLKRVFKLSIKDPQQMPPKCCTTECIPLKHVARMFDDHFKRTWNRKFAEFSTRNRIYCPGKKCGAWIKPDKINTHRNGRKIAKCDKCSIRVCCACNNKWHESRHCPADEETNRILQQAKEEGWQRCFNCKTMVELKEGCNHMTCRCGAEFCMICGLKWKTCECPWFSYDTVEQDRLDHMQIPVPAMDHERFMSSRETRSGLGHSSGGPRHRPRSYEEEMHMRRLQEQQDESLARRLQYEDVDDGYMGRIGEVVGLGNAARHFMNEDYRRGTHNMIVPPPVPAPPGPHPPNFERTNSVTDYVSGVNRARGVRASSMERRLADRFSDQRHGSAPNTPRSFGNPHLHASPIPYPPIPPRTAGPPPPPMIPSMHRRHTMDDELGFDAAQTNPRLAERLTPRRAATRDYVEGVETHSSPASGNSRRRHHRGPEYPPQPSSPPRSSVLAGLTGPGSGMNRVYEWRDYVSPGAPDHQHPVAT